MSKKVLLFTEWYEPGFKAGGPIQSCRNVVRYLSGDYKFFILTTDRDLGDNCPYKNISTDQWLSINDNAQIWYASPGTLDSKKLELIIKEVNPDVVYLNSMYSRNFTLLPLWVLKRIKFSAKIVLAPRGMLHEGAVSSKKLKKKIFLFLIERTGLLKRVTFHATDNNEKKYIKQYFKKNGGIVVAGNLPTYDNSEWKSRDKNPGIVKCIFASRIHPHKNLLTAIKAVLNIQSGCRVILDIYGVIDDKAYYEQCADIAKDHNNNIEINFKGPLPHIELFTTLKQYHLFILPTLGENFGHVIFEAMSAGCPVLISDKTPWSSVMEKAGGWAIPYDDVNEYTNVVMEVCAMDRETLNLVSLNVRNYADHYIKSINISDSYSQLFR